MNVKNRDKPEQVVKGEKKIVRVSGVEYPVNCGRQFCVCVRLPVQMHAEQIEVGGHFVSLSRKFYQVLMQESGLIFT